MRRPPGDPDAVCTAAADPSQLHHQFGPSCVPPRGVPEVGGHRLRHALATEMLSRGANLIEVAQVLRHSDLGTTSDYAKIDRTALQNGGSPWRGCGDEQRLRPPRRRLPQATRALGHDLADAARLLPRFVAHLDAVGASRVTAEVALAWVRRPDADPRSSVWMRRMIVVRGFARHMSGIDPATEVPPLGLVTYRQRWRPPFIYSDDKLCKRQVVIHRTDNSSVLRLGKSDIL